MLMGLAQTAAAQTIANTITQVEGYYPGTLAYTNNNPGNLIYVGQAGATLGAGGFAAFPSYQAGYQALLNQIGIYANQGLTIDQMMAKYAPAGQGTNNPSAYAQTIADTLGVSPLTTVADAIAGTGSPSDTNSASVDTSDASVSMLPSIDSITSAFSDLGTAISTGSTSSISDSDYGVLATSVLVIGLGIWVLSKR